jgi:thymidylate synthase
MQPYLDDLQHILLHGDNRRDRTGVGTRGVFGLQSRYDLRKGFPAVTTKKLAFKAVVSELIWFVEGSNDERRLCEILYGTRDESKKTIWTENAEAEYWKPKANFNGDVGRVYGQQWRDWGPRLGPKVDQLANLIEGLKKDPFGRRHIITAWQPGELSQMALPPCHVLSQFYVNSKNELSCQMYQRSADFFLGVPFNITSYSLLTHMLAQVCGLEVGEFIHTVGDAHIYTNHFDQVKEQICRTPFPAPKLVITNPTTNIDEFKMEDFVLAEYSNWPAIKAEMAV